MENEKTQAELLKEKLFATHKSAYELCDEQEILKAYDYCGGYMKFLNAAKTERECVSEAVKLLDAAGFTPFEYGKSYATGDKFYLNNRGKALYAVVMGKKSLEDGLSVAAGHIDSPRIDLKQNPLYEEGGMAFFKTHYYGGIKKFQWVTIPLALHGVIVKEDGTVINVCIGEDESDPVFYITDVLPHLGKDQAAKTVANVFTGENLNVLVGGVPYNDDGSPAPEPPYFESFRFERLHLTGQKQEHGAVETVAPIEIDGFTAPGHKIKNVLLSDCTLPQSAELRFARYDGLTISNLHTEGETHYE